MASLNMGTIQVVIDPSTSINHILLADLQPEATKSFLLGLRGFLNATLRHLKSCYIAIWLAYNHSSSFMVSPF